MRFKIKFIIILFLVLPFALIRGFLMSCKLAKAISG